MTQQLKAPPPPLPVKMSYGQFLEWDSDNQHVEWVNGQVVPMAPIGDIHQDLGRWQLALLTFFVDRHHLGAIRYEPFQMKSGPGLPGRAPDILFVARRNLSRLKKNHLQGPADLVVEIISPGSEVTDRGAKYFEYEQGGVKEYWLIDPRRKQADFYLLGRDRVYHLIPLTDGVFQSAVLKGLWLDVTWLWQKPLPPTPDIWKKWTRSK